MLKYTLYLILIIVAIAGCNNDAVPASTPRPVPFQGIEGTPPTLPTVVPATKIRPTNTLVMANPWTPTPIPSATPLPSDSLALVTGVLSPETVVVVLQDDNINHTYVVRLLGIDAPNNSPAEPWGQVAFNSLDHWLTGNVVRVVQDTTIINANDELPRYVYLNDSLINLRLIELGLARAAIKSPDILFRSKFEQAAQTAQSSKIGLWGPNPTPTPAAPPTPTLTVTLTITPTPLLTATSVITTSPVITRPNAGP